MNECQALTLRKTGIPVAASDRFRRFAPEGEHAVRVPAGIKADLKLEALVRLWRSFGKDGFYAENSKETIQELMAKGYCPEDIERFCIVMGQFSGEKNFDRNAGKFLSEAIASCPGEEFILHVKHLGLLEGLGCANIKNVTIDGDVGGVLGGEMVSGRILLRGSAGPGVGLLQEGGEIIIEGNAGSSLGFSMRGGVIRVAGDAGRGVGEKMSDGEIHVDGSIRVFGAEIKGGKIFNKGILVWDLEGGYR